MVMRLTITLRRSVGDRPAALHRDQIRATFAPQALRVDQPRHLTYPPPPDPVASGQRRWATQGCPTLTARCANLPLVPHRDRKIVMRTKDADRAGIPWAYRHRDGLYCKNRFQ